MHDELKPTEQTPQGKLPYVAPTIDSQEVLVRLSACTLAEISQCGGKFAQISASL